MAFGRIIEIVGGLQGEKGTRILALPFSRENGDSLHVDCDVSASTDGQPAKLSMTVFNPPRKFAQDLLSGGRGFVSVRAGHEDSALVPIFAGIPVLGGCDLKRESTNDVVLKVDALAGGTRYRDAAISVGNQGYIKARDVANEVATSAGWVVGRNQIPATVAYPRGFAAGGSAARALERICRYAGVELSFPYGDRVDFLLTSAPGGSEVAVRLSHDKGNLIGYPTYTDDGRISFDALVAPGIEVGKQVVLRYNDLLSDRTIQPRLLVQETKWSVTNYGQNFYVHAIGKPVI